MQIRNTLKKPQTKAREAYGAHQGCSSILKTNALLRMRPLTLIWA